MNDEYLKKLYGWIKSNDSSYGGKFSYEQFSNKMEDGVYAEKMHGWVKGIDPTFFSLEDFNSKIKKKSQAENGGSTLGVGSSVSPKTDGDYTYGDNKSMYRKQGENWLINNESTGGQYVDLKDPTGSRAKELNRNARKMSSLDIKSEQASKEISKTKDLSNVAETDSEIFTGYPGKEKNKYEFRGENWYEPNPEVEKIIQRETEKRKSLVGTAYEKTIAINIKNAIKDIPKTRAIKDDARIKALNKQFGKNAVAPIPSEVPLEKAQKTDQDYFTGAFGDVLRGFDNIVPLGFGDLVDDIARDVASGYRQGKSDEESFNIGFKGPKASYKEIQQFIDAKKNSEQLAPSAEMQDYQRIYEEEGKGFWGVVKGLANNPSVIPSVLISSVTGMATNSDAIKAGAAAVGTGATYGAATGATAGGVGAIPGAAAGAVAAVPYAFGLASSVVEMGATFGELLTEELKGKELTKENVKAILEDPKKLQSIRNKAIARGIIIGAADALTGKLASGVGAKIISKSAAKSATGAVTKSAVVKSTAAGAAIEAAGGSAGEATARGAIGQDMDVSEIALEGIAELPGGIRSTIQARLAKPSYKVNGAKATSEQVDELINTMTPDDLAKTKIEIKNDYEGREFKMQDKIVTNSIKEQVKQGNPELNEPSLNAITQLEKDLVKLEGNTTQTGKDKAAAIRTQIKNIQENQLQEEATAEAVIPEEISSLEDDEVKVLAVETLEEIPEQFRDRAKLSPLTEVETREKIFGLPIGKKGSKLIGGGYTYTLTGKEAKDYAIQEQTAGQVPVQPTTTVGEEVVQGEPTTEPQVLTEEGKAEEVAPLTIQEELQLIEEEKAKTTTLEAPVEEDNTFVYKINKETTPSGKGKWEDDFEIIDNRDGQSFGEDSAKWVVYNNVSGTSVDALSKKDAQDIIKNAPSYEGLWNEGETINFTELNSKQQENYREEFNRQKAAKVPVVEVTPQEKVATYRAEEQAELLKAIPKIESYKVKGKIDKTKMPRTVLAKYNKIYEKYNALISPLLEPVVKEVTKTDSFFNEVETAFPFDDIRGGYAVTNKEGNQIGRVKMSFVNDNTIKIDEIVSQKMGERTGNGSATMKNVTDIADNNNVTLTLTPNLIGGIKAKGFENSQKLKNFYKKFGFVVDEGKGTMTRQPSKAKAPVVETPIVKAEAPKAKGELPVLSWSNVDRYKDDVIMAMREIQNKLLTPLLALKYNTTAKQKKQIIDIRAKIALADKILKRNFAKAKREQAKIEKEKNIKPTAKVETTKTKVASKAKVEEEPVEEEAKVEPVVEEVVEVEQYQPITIEKIFNDRFSKENAISYDEEERETDNGRMSTYISSITMDVTNEDGDSIGTLTKLVDEDRIITWNGEDFDGNQLSEQDFDFKDDARQAIVDKWNKEQKKNFDREAKKKIKDAQKAKEKADKAAAKEEAKSASVVKKEEAPAPAKESTEDLMGAINSIKEDIEDTTKEIEDTRKVAREKINKIREEILDLKQTIGKEGTIMDLEADIKEIEDILKKDLGGLKLDLDRHVQALKEEVKKLGDLDAKAPENKKTLLSYLDAAIKTLNGLNSNNLLNVKVDAGFTITKWVAVGVLKKILQGIRAGVIAGNTINASIRAMAKEYRIKHKNKKITIDEFTKEIQEYLRNTFVDQKTNEQDIQEARDKFVEIREAVRKAKVAVKTESKALRANAENAIREMLKGKVKNLTAVQMKSIMLRLARFNVFSQTQYDKFIDYVDKVIGIADYDAKVDKANENRKTAKKNLPKLGDISSDLIEPLSRVLNINAKLIPKDVFESYSEIVEMLSKRDAILELNKRADLNESLDKIIESIELNEQRVSDLKELYDNFADKVVKNGVVNYAETLDKMLEDGVIDKTEHELMKTFKSKIQGAKVKDEMTEQQIADEKAELIDEINNTTITLDEIVGDEFRLERDLVKKLQVLLKNKESLESLNNKELKDLLRIIDNINNGFVSNATQQMVERLNFIEKSVSLEAAIPKTVAGIFKKIRQYITDLTSRDKFGVNIAPLFNIDEQFGDFKTKTIFNAVFEQSAVAQQIYQSEITDIQGELTQVEKAISNIFKNNGNKVVLSKFKMMIYMMQLEYNSNPNNNQVHQAMKTLDETIKFAKQNSKKSGYKAADIKQMEFIKEQFAKDGEIDIDKLYNSFNEAEKNALKKLQDINNRMTKKATYTASVINGKKIKPIKNYVFYNTISASDRLSTAELINNMSNNMNPTTTSKNLEERDGKVHPVNLNAFFAVNQSARSVLINYHMTEPIRTARKTLLKAMKLLEDNNATTDQYEILNTIGEAYDTATRDLLQSNFTQSNEVMNWLQKTGYRSMLASAPRAISELMSNVSFVMINNPRDMAVGMSEYWTLSTSEDAKDILTILGSKVTSRNYPSDKLSSGLVDLSAVTSKLSKNRNIRSREVNGVLQFYDNYLGKWVNGVEFVADNLISQPDKIVMKPLWFGAFARSFQKETGVAPDFDKIKANNEEYMDKYRDALVKAKNNADTQTISAGSSTNAYMGILQNVVREGDSSTKQIAKNFNKFMNKFTVQEYYTARKGVNALVGNGDIPWEQGAQILAAVTARMTLYVTATRLLSELMLSAFGYGNDDEDDEDKKTMLQRLYQGVVSSATTLLIGRSFGNIIRVIENSLIEKANEEYGEKIGLRNGEYDPYEDAVQFNQLQKGKIDEPTDLVKIIAGPYAPLIGVGELGFKLLEPEPKTERAKLTRAKEWYRAGMETLGLLGAVPFYRDVKKVALAEVYKELKKETKKEAEDKEVRDKKTALKDSQKTSILKQMMNSGAYTREGIKKELRKIKDPEYRKALKDKDDAIRKKILDKYGYENLTDFKRNDVDNYEIQFGEYSPYRIKREESARIANELEKRLNALKDGEEYYPTDGATIVVPKKKVNKYNRFESRTKVNRYNRFE